MAVVVIVHALERLPRSIDNLSATSIGRFFLFFLSNKRKNWERFPGDFS
jgi:hypothetical protein